MCHLKTPTFLLLGINMLAAASLAIFMLRDISSSAPTYQVLGFLWAFITAIRMFVALISYHDNSVYGVRAIFTIIAYMIKIATIVSLLNEVDTSTKWFALLLSLFVLDSAETFVYNVCILHGIPLDETFDTYPRYNNIEEA